MEIFNFLHSACALLILVDNTYDGLMAIADKSKLDGIILQDVIAGDNVIIDKSNPAYPIINANTCTNCELTVLPDNTSSIDFTQSGHYEVLLTQNTTFSVGNTTDMVGRRGVITVKDAGHIVGWGSKFIWKQNPIGLGDTEYISYYIKSANEVVLDRLSVTNSIECKNGLVYSTDPFGDGSLVAKYLLDGNAKDATGNYNGTITGSVSEHINGRFAQSMNFKGGRITMSTALTITGANPRTISAWVKTVDTSFSYIVILGGDGNNSTGTYFLLSLNSGATGNIGIHGYGDDYTVAGNNVLDGNWHQVVVTYNGSTVIIYQDGVELGRANKSYNTSNVDTPSIGQLGDVTIDQVEIYDRVLTAQEVTTLYNQTECI